MTCLSNPKEAAVIHLETSIKTTPIFILNYIGLGGGSIVHTYYNPTCGWEIAVEEQQNTFFIICIEKEKIVKVYR